MGAEEKILGLLRERKEEGILQSEISRVLGVSKSVVSEVLRRLEERGVIVRERVAGKSYRVWLSEFSPKPVEGLMRVGILRASEYPHILLACRDLGARVKVFDSAIDLTRSLSFGSIDIGVSPFVTQTLFALTLRSIKIHCVVAYNGSGLVMKKGVEKCRRFGEDEKQIYRYIIPNCALSRIFVKMNLREITEVFIPLRMCRRAQPEIRYIAIRMYMKLVEIFPELSKFTGPRCVIFGRCLEYGYEDEEQCRKCREVGYIEAIQEHGTDKEIENINEILKKLP